MCKIIFFSNALPFPRQVSCEEIPEKSAGKFVQLRAAFGEYLVFAPLHVSRYHADIIERFCNMRGIPGIYRDTEKRFEILDGDWCVIGGGKFMIDTKQRKIRLFDNSMAYGKFDGNGMKEKILSAGWFPGYDVLIE
jgi:hypothetical protein